MNPVNPMTYHLVKAEEAHRLARIERRAVANASAHKDAAQAAATAPVERRRTIRRLVGVGITTVALLLTVLVGGVLANEQSAGGGGGGGASRVSLQ